MAPIFVELSKKYENIIFLKVDVDEVKVNIYLTTLDIVIIGLSKSFSPFRLRMFCILEFTGPYFLIVQDVTSQWEVRAMPTFIFIKDGKSIHKVVGANKDELEKKCQQFASLPSTV